MMQTLAVCGTSHSCFSCDAVQAYSPLLLCTSLRLPDATALGATLWMSPDTPNSAATSRVSKDEVEVDMTRV